MIAVLKVLAVFPSLCSILLAASIPQRRQEENSGEARRLLGSSFAPPGDATFDYIVVGGGTAGLVVATRLAEDPTKSVAVIEAGSFYEVFNSNLSMVPLFGPSGSGKSPMDTFPYVDWQFQTQPQVVGDAQYNQIL